MAKWHSYLVRFKVNSLFALEYSDTLLELCADLNPPSRSTTVPHVKHGDGTVHRVERSTGSDGNTESLGAPVAEPIAKGGVDPEQETLLAESVGLALLVVLDRLDPAERLAFVLHDMFAVSFDEIASIIGRSPAAARQLASRARRRVRGTAAVAKPDLTLQREVAQAFLTALRGGDFEGLLAVLDPDVVVRLDDAAAGPGVPREIRGAENWAKRTVAFSRMFTFVQPALLNGEVGLIWAPRGRLLRVVRFAITDRKIVQVDVIADPARLRGLDVATLDN